MKLPFGITLHNHHLVYGWKHGILMWAPSWVQHAIVGTWNFFACRIYGHEFFGLPEEGIEVRCSHCSKKG